MYDNWHENKILFTSSMQLETGLKSSGSINIKKLMNKLEEKNERKNERNCQKIGKNEDSALKIKEIRFIFRFFQRIRIGWCYMKKRRKTLMHTSTVKIAFIVLPTNGIHAIAALSIHILVDVVGQCIRIDQYGLKRTLY